jgi:hypothetical protein
MIYIKILIYGLIIYALRGVILSLIAKLAGLVFEPLNLLSAIILNYKKSGFLKLIREYQLKSALETDIYLHYNFRALWRVTFSKYGYKELHRFGTNKDETLSSAIGNKFIESSLNWHGIFWYYFLYFVDIPNWRKGGHCKVSYYSYIAQKDNE